MPQTIAFGMPPSPAALGNDVPLRIQISSVVEVRGGGAPWLVHAMDGLEGTEVLAVLHVAIVVQTGFPEAQNAVSVL